MKTFIERNNSSINKSRIRLSKFVLFFGLILVGAIILSGAVSAANYNVGPGSSYKYHTINSAVGVAKDGDNIKVYPNTNGNPYYENIAINHRLNITASGKVTIKPANTKNSPLTIYSGGSGSTIQSFTINNTGTYDIIGIHIPTANNCKIINNTISNFTKGISVWKSGNTISGNNITSKANSYGDSFGIIIESNNNIVSKNNIKATGKSTIGIFISNIKNLISGNTITATSTGDSDGIFCNNASTNTISGNTIKVTGSNSYVDCVHIQQGSNLNTITGNNMISSYSGVVQTSDSTGNIINFNRILAKHIAILSYASGFLNAKYNWYGTNTPSASIFQGNINYSPWLVLKINANPRVIVHGAKSIVTADLLHDSNGVYHPPTNGHIINGLTIKFGATLIIMSGTKFIFHVENVTPSSSKTVNGTAQTTLITDSTKGNGLVTATLDNQSVSQGISVT